MYNISKTGRDHIILQAIPLGTMDYIEAMHLQEKLLQLRQQGDIGDVLLLTEHPPVITLGRNSKQSNILLSSEELARHEVTIYQTNRGGDVTYHGPGQIIGYPILDLSNHGKDIKKFVWKLEEVFIRLLDREYRIDAHREDDRYRGVWVGDRKITAIGIAVKRWVTMHGFAFNVNTHLEHFHWINPCGITDKGVTSLENLLGHPLDLQQITQLVLDYFCDVFNVEYEIVNLEALETTINKKEQHHAPPTQARLAQDQNPGRKE